MHCLGFDVSRNSVAHLMSHRPIHTSGVMIRSKFTVLNEFLSRVVASFRHKSDVTNYLFATDSQRFHARAQLAFSLKMKYISQFFTFFLMIYSMSRPDI